MHFSQAFFALPLLLSAVLAAPAEVEERSCKTSINYKPGVLHQAPNKGKAQNGYLAKFCNSAFAVFQGDGNFVVYPAPGENGFETDTAYGGCGSGGTTCKIAFTKSGDFEVIYDGYALFSTETAGQGATLLTINESAPYVVVTGADGAVLFSSGS